MRRLGFLLFLVVVVVVGLVASGLIRVDVHAPSGADAKPFWRDKPVTETLPDNLRTRGRW